MVWYLDCGGHLVNANDSDKPDSTPEQLTLLAARERIAALEEQLRGARRMAGIGKLAAGVAHDFNNVLTAILGHVEIALETTDDESVREDLLCIREVARSSAELSDQLLSLSRGGLDRSPVSTVDAVVSGLQRILGRALGSSIRLVCRLNAPGVSVALSRGQLEQIILSLALNARDAMPDGGTLTIETAVNHSEGGLSGASVIVTDTGGGMSPEQRASLESRRGSQQTGGLGSVRRTVLESGGQLRLDDEQGSGTRVELQLPVSAVEDAAAPPSPARAALVNPTVLLVEDDPQVRRLLGRILQRSGYRVLTASSGSEALETCANAEEPINLLLTDVIMPGMGGGELADRVTTSQPDVSVLFVSGYTGESLKNLSLSSASRLLLSKPFSSDQLLTAVSGLLGD